MVTTLGSEHKSGDSLRIRSGRTPAEIRELVAFCPKCQTLESLCFAGDYLMQTLKFSQHHEEVYHDCGAKEPCRLYRFSQVKASTLGSGY
jgi:hypothetical protein